MTPDQVILFCSGSAPYADALVDACSKLSVTDPHEQAMLLAQIAHESGGFRYTKEIWGPTAQQERYDYRVDLGNARPEALAYARERGVAVGRFYAGHGLIQITGYDNHAAYSRFAYGDDRCVRYPERLAEVPDCVTSALWFWVTKGCPALAAPGTDAAFVAVTKRINGGTNGLDDRRAWWAKAQAALGLEG